MKNSNGKTGAKKQPSSKGESHEQIKPDYPLSEKDEVKQAEEKMRKAAKKST